ncbi:hypothetical protein A9Q99_01975 [Gammaproteobacteria bacterium 45_16_T64]|nr:hypothetical protein A9Q99_01975 [Gammaproteobacteria bacterium 45_16_T64]
MTDSHSAPQTLTRLALITTLTIAISGCISDYGNDDCTSDDLPPVDNFWLGIDQTDVTFIAFGDSQFGGGAEDKNDLHKIAINQADVQLHWDTFGINAPVSNIRGIIMNGDITQNGRDGRTLSENEYKGFTDIYGLCGNRDVKFPMFEGYGNHDFFEWSNIGYRLLQAHPVADSVSVRNQYRVGLANTAPDKNGHYSWDWDNIHFVQLNLTPSDVDPNHEVPGVRNPRMALTFLKQDLAEHVAGTNKKVIIMSHYGPWETFEWDNEQIDTLYDAIKDYPVIAYLHGHSHATSAYTWNGIPVFNVGSPYYLNYNSDERGHYSVFRITDSKLYAYDVSWNPNNPMALEFPDNWTREIDL